MASASRIEGIAGGGRGPSSGFGPAPRTSVRVSSSVKVIPKKGKPFVNEKTTKGADQAVNQNIKKANKSTPKEIKANVKGMKAAMKPTSSQKAATKATKKEGSVATTYKAFAKDVKSAGKEIKQAIKTKRK
jgi:hypothetical protein